MKQLAIVLAACLALVCSAARAQQTLTSESKTWSVTMPAGWQAVSADQLTRIKAEYKARQPDSSARVVAAFYKPGSMFPFPQVVLQVLDTDMSTVSLGDLDDAIVEDDDSNPIAMMVAKACRCNGADEYELLEATKTVRGKGTTNVVGPGDIELASRASLWSGGVVQLTALDLASRAGSAQAVVDQWANTLKFEAGREFVPAADAAPAPGPGGGYGRYGAFGGGGAAVIIILAVVLRIGLRAWLRS